MMIQTRTKLDVGTNYKEAGVLNVQDGIGTQQCIDMNSNKINPGTPEHIKKYRKSYKMQEGTKILHYGFYDNKLPDQHFTYGKKSGENVPIQSILDDKNQQGINQLLNEIKESKYHSHITEPLAKGVSRNYQWPDKIKTNKDFQFGTETAKNIFSAKEIVNPADLPIKEDQKAQDLYLKSHKQYQPGQQKDRNYKLPFDKNEHVFGKSIGLVQGEGGRVIQPENDLDSFPMTNIVKKNQIDFKNFKEDPLGRPKNLGQINQYVNSDMAFGVKEVKDEWNAGKCIQGEAVWKEVKQDQDLGKATKFGFRNTVKEGDENRMFGVPTIRNDIQKKGLKSVADFQNYGDEPNSIHLLNPQKFSAMGLTPQDFEQLRDEEEIRDIFKCIGMNFITGKFQALISKAKEFQRTLDNKVSLQSFIKALQYYRDIQ